MIRSAPNFRQAFHFDSFLAPENRSDFTQTNYNNIRNIFSFIFTFLFLKMRLFLLLIQSYYSVKTIFQESVIFSEWAYCNYSIFKQILKLKIISKSLIFAIRSDIRLFFITIKRRWPISAFSKSRVLIFANKIFLDFAHGFLTLLTQIPIVQFHRKNLTSGFTDYFCFKFLKFFNNYKNDQFSRTIAQNDQ